MKPSKSIKIECGVCQRDRGQCTSKNCDLNGTGRPLEKIKKHCLSCSPDHRVEECTGQIIGTQAKAYNSLYGIPLIEGKAECPLYPFRYGHNPSLRHSMTEKQLEALRQGRKPFQRAGQEAILNVKFERNEA